MKSLINIIIIMFKWVIVALHIPNICVLNKDSFVKY